MSDMNGDTENTRNIAQQHLLLTLFNMKLLSPYYHVVLCAITRKPWPGLGTCAVTEDTLYYDPEFIVKLSVSELTFVLIHETMHIAMQHSIRYGERTNHDLWNIACDLYINTILCRDFGIQYGGGEKTFDVDGVKCFIAAPTFGVFPNTANQAVDLKNDIPESIYERLRKENSPDNGSIPGKDSPGSDFTPMKPFDVSLDGKRLQGQLTVDILTNRRYGNAQERQGNIDAGKMALQRIKTRIALEEEESGGPLLTNAAAGSAEGTSLLKRYIDFGLSQEIRCRAS